MRNPKSSRYSGQSMVEFALLLPLFILIVVVIFDLGRAVFYYSAIYNAAREGARNGVITRDQSAMETAVITYAYGLDPTTLQINATYWPKPVYEVRVAVSYTFKPAIPLVSFLLPGGEITLRTQSVMETEE
jgi:Flp pilus assembly protein TadG